MLSIPIKSMSQQTNPGTGGDQFTHEVGRAVTRLMVLSWAAGAGGSFPRCAITRPGDLSTVQPVQRGRGDRYGDGARQSSVPVNTQISPK